MSDFRKEQMCFENIISEFVVMHNTFCVSIYFCVDIDVVFLLRVIKDEQISSEEEDLSFDQVEDTKILRKSFYFLKMSPITKMQYLVVVALMFLRVPKMVS